MYVDKIININVNKYQNASRNYVNLHICFCIIICVWNFINYQQVSPKPTDHFILVPRPGFEPRLSRTQLDRLCVQKQVDMNQPVYNRRWTALSKTFMQLCQWHSVAKSEGCQLSNHVPLSCFLLQSFPPWGCLMWVGVCVCVCRCGGVCVYGGWLVGWVGGVGGLFIVVVMINNKIAAVIIYE